MEYFHAEEQQEIIAFANKIDSYALDCPNCGVKNAGMTLVNFPTANWYSPAFVELFALFRCNANSCRKLVLQKLLCIKTSEGELVLSEKGETYPNSHDDKEIFDDSEMVEAGVDKNIIKYYEEAVTAFHYNLLRCSAMTLREAYKKIKTEKNLDEKTDYIQMLGNIMAHDLDSDEITKEDVSVAIDELDRIIQQKYIAESKNQKSINKIKTQYEKRQR